MQQIELMLLPDLIQRAKLSENNLVQSLPEILLDLSQFRNHVERKFQWRETSDEVFKDKSRTVKNSRELNSLYWRDVGNQVKAYGISTTWRIMELLEQSVVLLNLNGTLGPAIIGRALIELTSTFILNSDAIRRYVEVAASSWHSGVIVSEELERRLLKAIYGTRLVPDDHYLSQTNILNQLKKLSRVQGYEAVMEKYNFMCEVAHPNVWGNACFWSDYGHLQPDGTTMREFHPRALDNRTAHKIQEETLWALAWAAANVTASFLILDKQIRLIGREFPGAPN